MARQQTGFTVHWRPTEDALALEVRDYGPDRRAQTGLLCLPCGCVYREKPQRVVLAPCEVIQDRWLEARQASSRLFADRDLQYAAEQAGAAVHEHLRTVKAWATRDDKKRAAARRTAGFERASGSWGADG